MRDSRKKEAQKRFYRDVYRRLFWRIAILTAAIWAVYWLLYSLWNTPLSHISSEVWDFIYALPFVGEPIVFFWILCFLCILALCYFSTRRLLSQMSLLIASIEALAGEETPLPAFPRELREVEVRLTEARQALLLSRNQAAEAEQRKNDLVVYLAHDLKTPLTSVIGYLSLLEEAPDMPPAQRAKYTGIALKKAYRLEDLVSEFFDITRFSLTNLELERGKVNLSLLLNQLADEFYPVFLERNLSCTAEIEPGIFLLADADKLSRVFDNLLRNALSYSDPGSPVRLRAFCEGGYAHVLVRNLGPEISPQNLERIFEKFFRSDSSRGTKSGGAGLGLAIAKQIVLLHGGSITAASSTEYTEFHVMLPLAGEAAQL